MPQKWSGPDPRSGWKSTPLCMSTFTGTNEVQARVDDSMVHKFHHMAPQYLVDYCIPVSLMWPVDNIFILPGVITSLCLDTVSARMGSVGHLVLLPNCPKLTER